ncbi:ErpL protein, partial [Borreliella burgdorferi]
KQIQELKDTINKLEAKKTSLKTYSEYEEQIKKIKEKLKDKKELEDKLKELEESLKKKKEERKKALEDAKKKFEEFKGQVSTTTGETHGHQVQNQGKIGGQAWAEAKKLGLNGSYSNSTNTNSNNFANEVIGDVLKKIEEELKKLKSEEK